MSQDRENAESDLAGEVAKLLGLPAEEVDEDGNLIALGLDSLAMMRLAGRLRRSGVDVSFAELAAEPTLAAWRGLLGAALAGETPERPEPAVDESEPFELALMQHAYWVGRAEGQRLGGVAAHFYNEFDGEGVDPARLESAVRALFARHGMLRVRVLDDGRQRIDARTGWPGLRVHDLRALPVAEAERELIDLRRRLSHRSMDVAAGEVFDIQLSLLPPEIRTGGTRVHVSLDMIAADALSLRVLLADLARGYADPGTPRPALAYSFARYLAERRVAQEAESRAAALDADREYWRRRLPDLPTAPQLPLITTAQTATAVRRHRWLDPATTRRLERESRRHGLTPAMALAAVFAEALTAFSAEPRFLLNLPLFNREQLHPEVNDLVGDFTSSVLLAWDGSVPGSFAERATRLQERFHADAAHAGYSGVEVLRDASRLNGEQVLAPVVYTSALGLGELFPAEVRDVFGEPSWTISQGPQVWLDAQVTELDGGLLVNWDIREDAFAPGLPGAMFGAYGRLLDRLLSDPDTWNEPVPALLPEPQRAVRARVNDTAGPVSGRRLHDGLFAHAVRHPEATALRWGRDRSLSYGDLAGRALTFAAHLKSQGVGPGDLVTVTLPKGPEQITAVLGVLAAGAAYLPVGIDQPELRRERIHRIAGARLVLDDVAVPADITPLAAPVAGSPGDLAYVIFTSGSTGEPKGVEITHAAAMNTIDDVNERFAIGPQDRTLALSALDFDLSVYDIFGPLSVGGVVVLVEEESRRDAPRWLELVRRHRVTVWNTVPALVEMLLIAAEGAEPPEPLRLVLASGDWVGLDLPGRVAALRPGCRFVALGGATEAAIWSNAYEVAEVDPGWRSVPYGFPLRNQRYRVVDALGRDCPDRVTGELWIGGAGVARGYRGAPEFTAARFVEAGGDRWYRTGDLGRYWPDGTLEFLGRADQQVKVRGHRIELGEIEAALTAHPGAGQSVAVVCEDGRLAAAITAASTGPVPDTDAGTPVPDTAAPDVMELRAFLAERLPPAMVPERIAVLSELPLTPNGKIDRAALRRTLAAHDVHHAVPFTPPDGEIERRAAAAWSEILGVADVGREHDFFALGGDSLLATRLIRRLHADGFAEVELAQLFRRPLLADFAATLRLDDTARPRAVLAADPEHRLDPFPLTDVQRAYWLGRSEDFTLGGIGCHFYREYDVTDLDVPRLEAAVDRLVRRHEMLRAVVDERGEQRILPDVPHFRIVVTEADPDPGAAFEELREAASHQVFDPAAWPLFSIRAVRSGDRTRIGIGADNIVLDALSILTFYTELGALYEDLDAELPPVGVSFRDYVLSAVPEPAALATAREHWTERLPDLPPAPQLPLATDPSQVRRPRFTRREARIGAADWQPIADRAREHGITPSVVLLTAFAEVLGRWSARADLTLNLTLFDRKDLHPDIANVLGDFTSLMLVASRPQPGESWLAKARRTQRELWAALDHREVSAVWILRELARHTGESEVTMPVVFTSALGVGGEPGSALFTDYVWGVSQTPQAWLDHQVTEAADGGVRLNWDVVEELFPGGVVDAMFDAYLRLLGRLSRDEWDTAIPDLLPSGQREIRARANGTGTAAPARSLHAGFFQRAAARPDSVALRWGDDERLGYGELAVRALRLAALLIGHGVQRGEVVAVHLPKGPNQIAAVLGVLAAGAAYLPVGVDQPAARRDRIHRLAGVRFVVTDGAGRAAPTWPEPIRPIVVDEAASVEPAPGPVETDPGELAYVIFTSGSTGEPKGVEITHAAAANTIDDVNERFDIGPADRSLALSALDFDLSVYDVFGPLSAGGAVVLVEEESRRDARRWLELVRRHRVTVWNTVPALLEMLLTVAEGAEPPEPLRLVLASGDWVGLDLPGRVAALRPGCRFVALGGATEAAIWSNHLEVTEVDPGWRSVPYGFPLRGQRYRVVDALGRDCPDWVPGELWIGGAGVARGYRGAPGLTAARFVKAGGDRWYRTGDLGRYWPDGTLEFLGRTDQQVKIRGHRIELGEIETALTTHPGVGRAVVAVTGDTAARRLAAAVVPAVSAEASSVDAPSVDDAAPSATAPSAAALAERARAIQQEAEVAEAVLARLLRLDEVAEGTPHDFAGRLDVTDEHLPTLRLWLRWLAERKVLVEEAGTYGAGPGLPAALTHVEPRHNVDGGLVARVHARLMERLEDHRRILSGRLDPAVLLDDDALAPASLAAQDPGAAQVIAEIAGRLTALAESMGRPVEVAELDGREGRTAARLLGLLGPDQVRYTLLDPSPAMVAASSRRLEGLPHEVACHRLHGVSDELRYRFDVVVADNALHRYPDPARGLALAGLLMRRGGRLIAVERAELTPIVLLTGALLDRGYAGFDRERRQAGSPMLPGSRWIELFSRAGLVESSHRPIGAPFTEVLWARRPETAVDLDPEELRAHVRTRLPAHMSPDHVEVLPWLPLSANGKVDRAAVAALAGPDEPADPDEVPRDGLEQEIALMWTELLGHTSVGRRRSFFELGGDSLLATRFVERVKRRYGVELPLRRMFAAPSLTQVTAVLTEEVAAADEMEEGVL